MASEPTFTIIRPLYQPLGFFRYPSGETRYYISVRDDVRVYRGRDMIGIGFLFDIYPDPHHWRHLFSARVRGGIDTREAAAWFIKECQKCGTFDPPAELKPRPVGRPKRG